jgi:hypothetical protein
MTKTLSRKTLQTAKKINRLNLFILPLLAVLGDIVEYEKNLVNMLKRNGFGVWKTLT